MVRTVITVRTMNYYLHVVIIIKVNVNDKVRIITTGTVRVSIVLSEKAAVETFRVTDNLLSSHDSYFLFIVCDYCTFTG